MSDILVNNHSKAFLHKSFHILELFLTFVVNKLNDETKI